jgi:hypothetical protein
MKTMTLLAALALVALVSGATPASALDMAQTREDGATGSNCTTPMPPAQRIADAGLTLSRIWERSQHPDYIIRILPKGG